jgi:hypothetical protein
VTETPAEPTAPAVPVRLSPPNDGYRSTSIEMIGVGEGGRTCLAGYSLQQLRETA